MITCYLYKLIRKNNVNNDMFYLGSTISINKRFYKHMSDCYNTKKTTYENKLYKHIRENGGISDWEMIVIDTKIIPEKKCPERFDFENEYIIKYDAINKLNTNYARRSTSQYLIDNADRIRQRNKIKYLSIKDVYNQKTTCEKCGCNTYKRHLKRHQNTALCLKKCENI